MFPPSRHHPFAATLSQKKPSYAETTDKEASEERELSQAASASRHRAWLASLTVAFTATPF
jgi:hypothetical protein